MSTDLWRFAEALYQRPGIEAACLQLQAQGADVCLLLCAAWLERHQVTCNQARIDALHGLARPWQQQVIEPLRQVRQAWREQAQRDKPLAHLREQVKRLELEAERELLERLAAQIQNWLNDTAIAPAEWLERLADDAADHDALHKLRTAAAQLTD